MRNPNGIDKKNEKSTLDVSKVDFLKSSSLKAILLLRSL